MTTRFGTRLSESTQQISRLPAISPDPPDNAHSPRSAPEFSKGKGRSGSKGKGKGKGKGKQRQSASDNVAEWQQGSQ